MLFAVATPTLMEAPMRAGTLNVCGVDESNHTMPENPAGNAVMMMNGFEPGLEVDDHFSR